jgi:hypothetical protein
VTTRERPGRATLGFLRKLGIGAFSGFLVSFLLALTMAALPFDVPMQFEIAYVGIGVAILCSLILAWLTTALRALVPQDQALRTKVRQYFWFCGPIGLLAAVLALTKSDEGERGK